MDNQSEQNHNGENTESAIPTTTTTTKPVQPPEEDTSSKLLAVKSRESAKYCWVCFASDEDDLEAAWVQPCKCRGTTKWVSTIEWYRLNIDHILRSNRSIKRVCNDGWTRNRKAGIWGK